MSEEQMIRESVPLNEKQETGSSPFRRRLVFAGMLIFAVGIFMFLGYYMFYDTDMMWTIATGDEILENGIPYVNPFTVVNDSGIVVQQWLFAVILALFDRAGGIGWIIFSILNSGFIIFCTFLYLHRSHVNPCWKTFFIACVIAVTGYTSILRPRPESMTIGLLMLNCYALERYRDDGNIKILALLPLTMLLEANLHGAMILFHFTVYLAYLVPFPKLNRNNKPIEGKTIKNESIESKHAMTGKKRLTILAFILASCVCMLINPYGINMVLYLPESYFAGTFSIISIGEMQSDSGYIPFLIAGILIAFAFTFWLLLMGRLRSEQIWLLLGYSFISALAVRNVMFLYIAFIVLLPSVFEQITEKGETEILKLFSPSLYSIVIIAGLLLGLVSFEKWQMLGEYLASPWKERTSQLCSYDKDILNITDYLIDAGREPDEPVKIFTGFNSGGYIEYTGKKAGINIKIFMDARPELAMKAINKKKDWLKDYVYLCVKYDPEEYDYNGSWQESLHEFIDEYDFDYLLIQNSHDLMIASYMLGGDPTLSEYDDICDNLPFTWSSDIYDDDGNIIYDNHTLYEEKLDMFKNEEDVISADGDYHLVAVTDSTWLWEKNK